MEMVLNNGFCEMSQEEMENSNAGGAVAVIGTILACLDLGQRAFECGEKIGRIIYLMVN